MMRKMVLFSYSNIITHPNTQEIAVTCTALDLCYGQNINTIRIITNGHDIDELLIPHQTEALMVYDNIIINQITGVFTTTYTTRIRQPIVLPSNI